MVRARAVIHHSAAELGEQQDDNFLIGVMLFQILVEVGDGVGHVAPQFGESDVLVSMGIECAWIDACVKYPGPEVCQMHLGDVLDPLCQGASAVLHAGRVVLGGGTQYVRPSQGVQTGLGQVVTHRAGANHGSVHPGEDV